jgi:hypothetical protein
MTWLFSKAMMDAYENSHCSQAQGGGFSVENSLTGEPSAQLNVMPTPHKFWRNDKTMEFSKLSQFGLTLRLLTDDLGAALLTSYLAAFPVRTSVSLGGGLALKVQEAECGKKWRGLLAKYNPDTHSWKTAQCSLLEDLEQSLAIWPRWGSMRNGECFLVEMSAVFTYEKESGLSLPTPTCSDNYTANLKSSQQKPGSMHSVTLPQYLKMMLPTLGANEFKGSGKDRFLGSANFRGAKMSEGLRTCETDPIYLNPSFAELVMMWPVGWTELKPLAMGKFQEWQQQHSSCSEKELSKAA